MWIGGLASFTILVLVISAYVFSSGYVHQYPAENVGPSNFACDTSIRNSKYTTGLQALSVPISGEAKPVFDLLNKQQFILHIDLLNTVASCTKFTAWQILGSSTKSLSLLSCADSNGILAAQVSLPYQGVSIQFILSGIQLVGALGVRLKGEEYENGSSALKRLDFRRTFYVPSDRTLAQTANIYIQLTKVNHYSDSKSYLNTFLFNRQ